MRRVRPYRGPYRIDPQPSLDFSGYLIVDLFAGGGGASTGIEWALGRSPDIAVNHDPQAVALHQTNHPHTRHFCESVYDVVPQVVCGGRPVGDLWMSPDCTHHSKARGGKPVSKRVRGLAWVGKRWAATVKPLRIYLENVEEFQQWGPLVKVNGEMVPCKKRAGRTFRNFVRELRRLGYTVDWREMRACDYGAPTIRKRLFLVARCDGQPIVWPEATHADPKAGGNLLPWRTAAECIDWALPCPSIFLTKEEGKRIGVRRPLVENTMRRVARGVGRYVIEAPEPFIVPLTHHGKRPNHSINEPFKTITAANRGELALVVPSLTEHANGSGQRTFAADEPLRTQCAQVKGGHFAVQAAMLLKHYGGVTGTPVDVPAGTVTTVDHHGLAVAHMVRHFGESVGSSCEEPVGTIMPGGQGKTGVVAASLTRHYGKSDAADVATPHLTITGKSKDSLVTSNLVKLRGTCRDGQRTDVPAPTITAGGFHVAEVRAFLLKYYGAEKGGVDLREPMHTIRSHDCFGLVMVRGELYQIVDIGMRMLTPRELYRAQGFPDSYIIEYIVVEGRKVKLSATAQVRMVGNSVSPYAAAALVAANTGAGIEWLSRQLALAA